MEKQVTGDGVLAASFWLLAFGLWLWISQGRAFLRRYGALREFAEFLFTTLKNLRTYLSL
jgi:hypothetical protein